MNGQGLGGVGFSGGIGQPGATGMGPGNMGGGFSGGGFGFGAPRMAWDDPRAVAALDLLGIQGGGNGWGRALNFYKQFGGRNGIPRATMPEAPMDPNHAISMAMMRMMQGGVNQPQQPAPRPALSQAPTPAVNRLPPRPVLSPYQGLGILMKRFGG